MHHAYVYEGSLSELAGLVADARARFGFGEQHNPDMHIREFEKFGIDESRWLTAVASLRSASGRALFVLATTSITTEAQQALLKLLEEPQQGTMFVLLVPYGILLPTIRSRTMEYPNFQITSSKNQTSSKFLEANNKERSDMIAAMLKDEEGLKERVREFVNALEAELHVRLRKSNTKEVREGLQDISLVRDYLRDRSPALKMLLEHLALSLP